MSGESVDVLAVIKKVAIFNGGLVADDLDKVHAAVAELIDKVDSYLTLGHSDTATRELRAALSRIQPDGQG